MGSMSSTLAITNFQHAQKSTIFLYIQLHSRLSRKNRVFWGFYQTLLGLVTVPYKTICQPVCLLFTELLVYKTIRIGKL